MPQAYFALTGTEGDRPAPVSIVVQGSGEPAALAGTLRSTVQSLDSSMAVFNVATVPQLIATSMTTTTFQTFLLGVFAGLALLLASVGIYGVLSYVVTQRTNEIGIRMALGAGRGNVLWMIMRQGLAADGDWNRRGRCRNLRADGTARKFVVWREVNRSAHIYSREHSDGRGRNVRLHGSGMASHARGSDGGAALRVAVAWERQSPDWRVCF